MERVQVGMHVEIKRSDGRVHSAIVAETRPAKGAVLVEWYEQGETKGKEVFLKELYAVNPMLVPKNNSEETQNKPPPALDRTALVVDDDDLLWLPKKTAPTTEPPTRRTIAVPKPSIVPPKQIRTSMAQGLKQPKEIPKTLPLVRESKKERESFMVETPSREPETVRKEPSKSEAAAREVEKIKKEREERRAQQEIVRKTRDQEKALDPGNPNYQFAGMIREYQSNIDFRPLRPTDAVSDNRISVCVRKRPMSTKELTKKDIEVVTIPNQDHVIVHQPQVKVDLTKYLDNQKFRFDYAFDENVDNPVVYRFTAQPLVRSIFEQSFSTCFAYGQTGSGKTHTMGGDFSGKQQDWSKGIYSLAANDVFRLQRGEFRSLGLEVGCSFFEIYGGKVFDLLKNKNLLRVLEDGKKEVQVVGLKEESVTSDQQVLDLIKRGSDMRTAGATSANTNSSRSHAIFQIILRRAGKVWGKFSLIDLAGNERGQDTGTSDRQTRMEGAEINKSLLALKECIRAMGRNSSHVPFRQSKLTMVLRDSFVGDKSRTCMIAMISPTMGSCEHTLNTLRYADRVKELGCEDGENLSPMQDEDFMTANPEAVVEEVLRMQFKTGKNNNSIVMEKILAAMVQCEEKCINDMQTARENHKDEAKALNKLMHAVEDPDYDVEATCKSLIGQLEQELADRRNMLDNAQKWHKVIRQEAEAASSK
ncbi:unnamed protein product, partial [Mesorhabditis spiculigera]